MTRYERGRPVRMWQPKREGERNEALDTMVYATAALLAAPEKSPETKVIPQPPPRRRVIDSGYV